MHECEVCGQMCDCDGEDMANPQPEDCEHLGHDCEDEYGDDFGDEMEAAAEVVLRACDEEDARLARARIGEGR